MSKGSGVKTPLQAIRGAVADRTPDAPLDAIAQDAVTLTGASWAAITVRLDPVVFFRGHAMLPPRLASLKMIPSRGSLCEQVIDSGEPLEIADIKSDDRGRTDFRRHVGVAAYHGRPLHIQGVAVGTLCVHDTRPRTFDGSVLERLARSANHRLEYLSIKHRQRLVELALRPALADLRNTIAPMQSELMVAAELLAELDENRQLATATFNRRRQDFESIMQRFQRALIDVRMQIRALRMLNVDGQRARVNDISNAADTLARHHTVLVGGARWVGEASERDVVASPQMSIALISTTLSLVAQSLHAARRFSGIDIRVTQSEDVVRFEVHSGVPQGQLLECRAAITTLIEGEDATVDCDDGVLVISLRAA